MHYPSYIQELLERIKKLPGVGARTAERYVFHMLSWSREEIDALASSIENLHTKRSTCSECHALIDKDDCKFCTHPNRDQSILCVVSSVKDVFAIEGTHEYRGLYHILGGLLSPMEGKGPEVLALESLKQRISERSCKEIILALDATIEGDATALLIKEELSALPVAVTRLALGLPMGSSLEYVDGGTLAQALHGRMHYTH